LPYLEKAQNARIINVASLAHTYSKMDLNDINADNHAGSFLWSLFYTHISYGNSKLANILHAATLN
jgi:NAD(P)-dependent dehydrogenase (short-subunit alcohol dehydrogenase family)